MKRIGFLILILAVTSCNLKLQQSDEPIVKETISLVQVNIAPFTLKNAGTGEAIPGESSRIWRSEEKLGIIGEGVANKAFFLRKAYDGVRSQSAEFYGEPVSGSNLTAYFPWNENGTVGETAVQQYEADPYDHFTRNSPLSAHLTGENLTFVYSGGLIKLTCSEELGMVQSLHIQSARWGCEVTGINTVCSAAKPLIVFVQVPTGDYRNFNVTYRSATSTVSMPALTEITIKDYDYVSITARQQSFTDGIDNFQGEGGSYSDQPNNY